MKASPPSAASAPFRRLDRAASGLPPEVWFGVGALSRYLGPAFAVLLFPAVGILGVAWFRVATAALVFAPLTRPWRTVRYADARTRVLLLSLEIGRAHV